MGMIYGDVLDVLSKIESNSIDTVISSPPYYGLRDYGTDTQWGLEETPELYLLHMTRFMEEIKRVLKPDGKVLFSEHGIAPDKKVIKWQNKINPFWNKLFGGCNLNRDIPSLIDSAGFDLTFEQMYLPSTPKFIGFNSWGEAKKN